MVRLFFTNFAARYKVKKMERIKKYWLVIVMVLFGIAVFYSMFMSRIDVEETAYLYVDADDNGDSAKAKLDALRVDYSKCGFSLMASLGKLDSHMRPGRYLISRDMTTFDLFHSLRSHLTEPLGLVVPTARTVEVMAGKLASQLMVDSAHVADYFLDDSVMAANGYTRETLPALFIPNTYEVFWELTPAALTNRLVREHDAFWNFERKEKARKAGLTPVEVATLASIVDSESANDGEKPRIAGLYINRLHKGIPLQSDPTIIFAVGDFSIKRVTGKYLQIDSPYNTYRRKGLPPGPICIPSVVGIDAVLNYEHHDYIYMCAKEDFSGTHNFAVSYAEHSVNARRYAEALNRRGIE